MTQPKTGSKFTPGPWRITEGPPGAITRQTRPGLHNVTSAPGFTVHARNSNLSWPGSELVVASYTYTEANARLIAAAPEMYELLEQIGVLLSDSEVRHALSEVGEQAQVHKLLRMTNRIKAGINTC